jgi:hypothetical protein
MTEYPNNSEIEYDGKIFRIVRHISCKQCIMSQMGRKGLFICFETLCFQQIRSDRENIMYEEVYQ